MRHLFNCGLRRIKKGFAILQTSKNPLILSTALIVAMIMTGCKKEASIAQQEEETQTINNSQITSNGFGNYKGLDPETEWELRQAKEATAKYNNFNNAIADGYVDINVIVPEMGYHFLKMDNLDNTFEFAKPEILVYNKEENGKMKLVALEYATPVSQNPPAGFTGNNDHWSVYQGVLWTLHAWVWEYNPSGVFNPTNPLVHLH
jgi:hypothetical protein